MAIKKAKLGMTVGPPKKDPYAKMNQRVNPPGSLKAQEKLERQGTAAQRRTERRIPQANPPGYTKTRRSRT